MRILIVEDEKDLVMILSEMLSMEGYCVDYSYDGAEGLDNALSGIYDVIILDIMLPKMDGISVLSEIRRNNINTPVLMLTARSEIEDKITGLDNGADDYLTKPFSVEELLARLRVVERRMALMNGEAQTAESVYTNGRLRIDFAAGCAYMGDKELHLTSTEYKLLCLMAKNTGKVLTHTYITQKVWGSSWENDIASLRVFMATLRKKLENGKDGQQYIQTHIGIGYRMLRVE